MIDWNEIGRQIQPGIVNVLMALLGLAGAAISVVTVSLLAKKSIKAGAEAGLAQLQHAKEIAEVSVKAVEQSPDIQTNVEKKSSAMDTMSATVPKLGDHLHDKLVEAAVKDMKETSPPSDTLQMDEENAG